MKHFRTYLFLLICLLSVSAFAQGDKQKELEEKRQAILEEIKQINSFQNKKRGEIRSFTGGGPQPAHFRHRKFNSGYKPAGKPAHPKHQ